MSTFLWVACGQHFEDKPHKECFLLASAVCHGREVLLCLCYQSLNNVDGRLLFRLFNNILPLFRATSNGELNEKQMESHSAPDRARCAFYIGHDTITFADSRHWQPYEVAVVLPVSHRTIIRPSRRLELRKQMQYNIGFLYWVFIFTLFAKCLYVSSFL